MIIVSWGAIPGWKMYCMSWKWVELHGHTHHTHTHHTHTNIHIYTYTYIIYIYSYLYIYTFIHINKYTWTHLQISFQEQKRWNLPALRSFNKFQRPAPGRCRGNSRESNGYAPETTWILRGSPHRKKLSIVDGF